MIHMYIIYRKMSTAFFITATFSDNVCFSFISVKTKASLVDREFFLMLCFMLFILSHLINALYNKHLISVSALNKIIVGLDNSLLS